MELILFELPTPLGSMVMDDEIVFAAISQLANSTGDGIHLLWTPPRGAGFAVGGFDIQRRKARTTKLDCHTLNENELAQLHRELEVEIDVARIGVREAECPVPFKSSSTGVDGHLSRRVDFKGEPLGVSANPLKTNGVTFQAAETNEIVSRVGVPSLQIRSQLEIDAPSGCFALRLIIRAEDVEAAFEATALDGTVFQPATISSLPGDFAAVSFVAETIDRIVIQADAAILFALEVDFRESRFSPNSPSIAALLPKLTVDNPLPPASFQRLTTTPACIRYEIDFRRRQRQVNLEVRARAVLAIATRNGKAVASRVLADPEGVQRIEFKEVAIDQTLIYVTRVIGGLTVCADVDTSEVQEWQNEPFIARGLNFPLVALDSNLGSPADEFALAKSRLLQDEVIDNTEFEEVARLLNETAAETDKVPPVLATLSERERLTHPFIELRPWPYALSLTLDPAWRRVFGCGHLDLAADLEAGETYDYRISGRFRRRDVEERIYGFHDFPLGAQLPQTFHLGHLRFRLTGPTAVELGPSASTSPLRRFGRKGVRLLPAVSGPSLALTFDQPISRLALDLDTDTNQTLSYEANPSDYLVGASNSVFAANLPQQPRVEITFPEPIDTLRLSGAGFLFAIRLLDHSSDAVADEIVERSTVVLGVRFEATALPLAPTVVETESLQQAIGGGDPAAAVAQGFQEIGFKIAWAPSENSNIGATPLPWPTDLAAQPPTDAAGFHVERRRVDLGEPFQEIDGNSPPTLFVGDRTGTHTPQTLRTGSDLITLYSDTFAGPPPDRLMDIEDVLVSAESIRALPGSLNQYRVFTVDAIGRRSLSARLGPETLLEKHRAPPQPVAAPSDATGLTVAGVRARLIQSADPDLTGDDQALLDASTNAIVIDWGWRDKERIHDPFAIEFRVYLQANPPDLIIGEFAPNVLGGGSGFVARAKLNQPVAADAMRGSYLNAGGYPFKVSGHNPGDAINVQLEVPLLEPSAVPGSGIFEFSSELAGDELRPTRWDDRVTVIPITDAEAYRFVIHDPVILDATKPRARVWVGVASADDQSYVADERPITDPNGGRPGNESSIYAVAVSGRYLGVPDFQPPPPLTIVPEHVTNEPGTEMIDVTLELDALLTEIQVPADHRVQIERVAINDLAPLLQATPNDRIGITLPSGAETTYTLANPQDQTAFLAQIRSGNPALVSSRFFLDVLQRFPGELNKLWQALSSVEASSSFVDSLSAKPERYFHRVRIVDAAGHVSRAGAILPQVVRTPSSRIPSAPEVRVTASATTGLDAEARIHAAYDLTHLLVFVLISETPFENSDLAAELLRLPNRRDLELNEGIRLRLTNGDILTPVLIGDFGDATVTPPDAVLAIPIAAPPANHVAVWCSSLTRDRIPSPLVGPFVVETVSAPIAIPDLTVTRQGANDIASWQGPGTGFQTALERSRDGGVTWERASPWLPANVTERAMLTPAEPRLYRLLLRGRRGAPDFGAPTEVS